MSRRAWGILPERTLTSSRGIGSHPRSENQYFHCRVPWEFITLNSSDATREFVLRRPRVLRLRSRSERIAVVVLFDLGSVLAAIRAFDAAVDDAVVRAAGGVGSGQGDTDRVESGCGAVV